MMNNKVPVGAMDLKLNLTIYYALANQFLYIWR